MAENEKSPKQILKLTLVLFTIAAITAFVLALTNFFTEGRIAEQNRLATASAYNEVLAAESYAPVEFDHAAFPTVTGVYKADDAGYVVELTFSGAMSTITAAVGIDNSGAVTGVAIIKHAETSGLGSKAADPGFRSQYTGFTDHVALIKSGGTIEAIAGATITSRAVTDAVNTAMDVAAGLIKEG